MQLLDNPCPPPPRSPFPAPSSSISLKDGPLRRWLSANFGSGSIDRCQMLSVERFLWSGIVKWCRLLLLADPALSAVCWLLCRATFFVGGGGCTRALFVSLH